MSPRIICVIFLDIEKKHFFALKKIIEIGRIKLVFRIEPYYAWL